jgi:integrase
MRRFTDHGIKALKPRAHRYEVYEPGSQGFGIRVTPQGLKSFITRYRRGRKLARITIGTYPATSLAQAHEEHNEHRKKLRQGVDPARQIKAERQREREAGTVGELAAEYIERHAKEKKRSWREDQRILDKDILPAWRDVPVKDISRRDVVRLLDRVTDRGALVMANRTLALLTKMFRFGIERGHIDASPCLYIKKPGGEEGENKRALDAGEIHTFWTKLGEASMNDATHLALRLILVTGQRPGEIAGATWSEIDIEQRLWSLPESRTKNKHAHAVPLSDLAIDLIEQAKQLAGNSAYVFPSPIDDGKPITARALSRAVARNQLGLQHWTPHALRKSARTEIGKLVDVRWAERVLNHLPPKLERTYDRHDYLPEKRQALEAWARRLQDIIDKRDRANVVPLAR